MLTDIFRDLTPMNCIFLAMAILSILLTIFFFFRSRKLKKPYYQMKSWNIVKDFNGMFESVKILREGEPVQNVTLTRVAFWNAGREPINRDDIAPHDLLRIKLKNEFKILEIPQLQGDLNAANNIKLITSADQSEVQFDFDYFGKDEGLVAQIVHDGSGSEDLKFEGTIKGYQIKPAKPVDHILSKVLMGLAMILLFIFVYRAFQFFAEDALKAPLRAQAQISILERNREALNAIEAEQNQSNEDVEKQIKEIEKRSEGQMKAIYPERAKPIYTHVTLWLVIVALIFLISGLALSNSKYTSDSLTRTVPKSLRDFND